MHHQWRSGASSSVDKDPRTGGSIGGLGFETGCQTIPPVTAVADSTVLEDTDQNQRA